ncbi:MAG: AAA family ATPase [Candidatus Nanoarchaeia archaeon]|nr:AAA family ATPase [Candidatus Nanoarchaeia archaeon]
MLWTEKYKPSKTEEIKGQEVGRVRRFVMDYSREKHRALLIYGPSGTGKTLIAEILAKELGYEFKEINSSDSRSKTQIEEVLGNILKQGSLFGNKKLILIDDIDSFSSGDRGGLKAVLDIISESKFPVIMTANEIDMEKMEIFKRKVEYLEFKSLSTEDISEYLKKICDAEKIKYEDSSLKSIARISGGDLRAAILDLQSLTEYTKELKKDDVENLDIRYSSEVINNILIKIFKTKELKLIQEDIDRLNIPLIDVTKPSISAVVFGNEKCLSYFLEENIPREYENIYEAFNLMSRADVFRGRIIRNQHWRYLVYVRDLYSCISLVKEKRNLANIKYYPTKRSPKNNFKLWGLVNRKRWGVADKIANHSHISSWRALAEIPYYSIISKKFDFTDIGLTEEEVEWLKKKIVI